MTIVNKVNDKMFIYVSVYPLHGYSLFISLSIAPRILLGMEEVNRHFVLKKR